MKGLFFEKCAQLKVNLAGFNLDFRSKSSIKLEVEKKNYNGEFDPGSGRTLAACLTHASLGEKGSNTLSKPAQG